jgi:transcription elongation GreA/GreB family factor
MNAKRKEILLELLSKAITQKENSLKEKVAASHEIAQAGMGSHSINSERHVVETVAETAKKFVEELINLKLEIENSPSGLVTKIEPPCWLEVEYDRNPGTRNEFYFLSVPILLPGVKIISPNSPFGKAIIGKGIGNHIEYETAGSKVTGVIRNAE